jgi:hypothetical protein
MFAGLSRLMTQGKGHCDVRLWCSVVDDADALRIPEFTSPLESELPEAGGEGEGKGEGERRSCRAGLEPSP